MRVERDAVPLGAFEFECGESVEELVCAYEAYGEFEGDNAVLVCHALTGSQHVTTAGGFRERGTAVDGTSGTADTAADGAGAANAEETASGAGAADGEAAAADESAADGEGAPDGEEPADGEGAASGDGPGGGGDAATDDGDASGGDADEPDGGPATSGQARAWWDDVVGPGKAVDTNEYYVVCVNVPGSCYGSTGPASEGPDGGPYATDFPPVTVGDWTRAQRQVLDHLGVGRLHAVVGGSVGGMNVLDWAKRYPDDVQRAIPVAAAARLDPQCLAIDAIARRAITTDPDWRGGDYYGDASPDDGLGLARQLGHVMYLSKASMVQKFGRRAAGRDAARDTFPVDPAAGFFPYRDVESYLDYQAEAFVDRFDANAYLYLTRAMDNYDLAAGYEDDADALAAFRGEALVMSFTADWHFTVEQSETLAEAFRTAGTDVAHHVVESDHGHDAFLVEPEKVGPPLSDFLADGVDGRAVTDTASGGEDGRDHAPVHSSLIGD